MDVRYVLAGIGEDWDYLAGLIREYNLLDVAHMIGSVADEALPRWMNACDVFAMPNREINGDNEGFGMVFIEASACGKPAVAGIAGGTRAAVLDGLTGFRVDGNRIEEVASALMKVLSDVALAKQLGRAGHDRAHAQFSWERVAEATTKVIEEQRE